MKLTMELVPQPCWGKNIRSELEPVEWDLIRSEVYRRAGGCCQICDTQMKLHAHEVWEYKEATRVMKLVGLIGICGRCHEVKHFGRASASGRGEQARSWFIDVNGITEEQATEYILEAFGEWSRLSDIGGRWKVDITYLKEFWES